MQLTKSKKKRTRKNRQAPLHVIPFTSEDSRANSRGRLTDTQKEELYRIWFEDTFGTHVRQPLTIFGAILGLTVSRILYPLGIIALFVGMAIIFGIVWALRELGIFYATHDIKIVSLTGTAHCTTVGRSCYIQCDDVINIELQNQPYKLFKPDHRYQVFMTESGGIILSAREINE